MLGDRIVIPKQYQAAVLKELHKGHPGQERMKAIMRSYVYWPGVDREVANFVSACRECAAVAKVPSKTLLSSWPLPSNPWQRIHLDYAGPFEGSYFLVIIDSYSKWPEIIRTSSISTTSTLDLLYETFARFGLPETIVTDNGTQFTSVEFKEFCDASGIIHLKTTPYHPQSNGQAERFVDTLKRGLRKILPETKSVSRALQTFLSVYRSTPNKSAPNGLSPAEILMGRRHRTTLDMLKPSTQATCEQKRNSLMEVQFNRHHGAKKRVFQKNQKVYASTFKTGKLSWLAGVVIERVGNVLYNVLLEGGKLIRAHTNQLRARGDSREITKKTDSSDQDLTWYLLAEQFESSENIPARPSQLAFPSQNIHPVDTPVEETEQAQPTAPRRSNRNRSAPNRYGQ